LLTQDFAHDLVVYHDAAGECSGGSGSDDWL
jgi:hypothetical protein